MKTVLFLLVSLVFTSSGLAYTYLWEDRFAQAPGSTLAGQPSETGTIWESVGPAGPGITVQAGNLAVPFLLAPEGNRARLMGVNGPGVRVALGSNVMGGTLYYSLALRVADPGMLGTNGGTLAAFNNATGSSSNLPVPLAARLLIRSANDGYELGLSASSGPSGDLWEDPPGCTLCHPFYSNQTVFVVCSYTLNSGPGNDTARLWVNPDPATFATSNAPRANLTATSSNDVNQLSSFVLMQRPQPILPAVTFVDEVRVGTTWASVTPPAPPDLGVAVVGPANPVTHGCNFTYSVAVTNEGGGSATSTLLTVPLPTGLTLVFATASQGSCSNSANGVQCSLGTLPPGGSAMVNVALFADFNVLATARNIPDAQETIDVTNSVAVASAEIDAAPADNSAVVAVAAVPLRDFGDAPFSATYHTLKVHDGARHRLVGPYFGGSPPGHAHRDADPDGMPSPNADGDNVGDGNNDEAGVRVLDPLIPGSTTVGVEINAPLGGRVDAWIDFDGNHSWADPGEQIFTSLAVPAGVSVHVISVPAGATPGDTHARFRISTAGGLSDYGYAPDGEDEDYKVTVTFPPIVAFADAAHTALGNAHLSLSANGLAISNLGSNGQDGVSIDLQELSRRATLSFGPAGFTLPGLGKLSFAAHGMVNDVPERSLGLVRFEEHNGTVNGFWCCAGDWFLQAPRLEVYNGATLVGVYAVSQDGFLGTLSGDGRLTDVSFVAERGHDAFWCYDGWWWFTPPGQPSVNLVVTQLRLVYVGSADQIENLARLDVTGSNIDTLLIQEENAPRFQPRLRLERAAPGINLKWDTRSAVLQSAPSVEGPWTNVREGTNATPTSATNANEFFRLQARPVELATPCFPFPGYVCKRNILLLVADDVGIDQIPVYVNYYAGTSHPITVTTTANPITTPTIDKLASAGVTFLNAWSCPTCSPTRAGLLTGLYSFRHGVYSPTVPDLPSDAKTIAQVLKDSGYATGMFGKWHLGSSTDYRPLEFGFDRYAGCLEGELTTSYYSWGKSDYALTALGGIAVPSGGTNITTTYATHQNVSDATNWIAGRTTPWMAAVTFNAGHWAKNGAGDRHYEMPPTGCPYAARTDDGGLNDFRSMIECMDRSIADLLSGIDSNVLEQTTIIFMGDNGTEGRVTGVNVAGTIKTVTIGEHFTSLSGVTGNHSKGSLYEGGIYVPLIIADGYSYVHPQQQSSWTKGLGRVASPGRFETAVVQTTDLFASMAKIGRGDASCGVDSVSLLPYLSSSAAAPQRDVIFAETYSGGQWDVAVRGESYKLIIRNYCVSPTYELYHLTSDPWETTELLSAAPAWALNGLIRNILNTRLDSLLSVPAACTITPVFPVPTVPCP